MGASTPGLMQGPAFLAAAGRGAHYPFGGRGRQVQAYIQLQGP